MLKKPITFEDFDGNERTETHYFNLNKGELAKMELTLGDGEGYVELLKKIAAAKDPKLIISTFEDFIARSYGVRSEDGQYFYKNDEILARFKASPAYDALLYEMCTDAQASALFVNGVVPASAQYSESELQARLQKNPEELLAELDKTPAELARERSESRMQGHLSQQPQTPQPQRVADPVVQPPSIPTQPQFQAPQPAFTPQELTDHINQAGQGGIITPAQPIQQFPQAPSTPYDQSFTD